MERLGNIDDLPPELKKQLNLKPVKQTFSSMLLAVLKEFGGEATLDELIVALYRKHGFKAASRSEFSARVYSVVQKGLVARTGLTKFGLVCKSECD